MRQQSLGQPFMFVSDFGISRTLVQKSNQVDGKPTSPRCCMSILPVNYPQNHYKSFRLKILTAKAMGTIAQTNITPVEMMVPYPLPKNCL